MKNIVWQNSKVSRSDRERINEHKGICIWCEPGILKKQIEIKTTKIQCDENI